VENEAIILLRLLLPASLAWLAAAHELPPSNTGLRDRSRPGPWDNDVLVYRIGKAHGYELDRGHLRELLGVAGVGLTSQVVEGYARKLLGGLLGKMGGGLMRDPQILPGPDGTFHMVWTTAWNKQGVGYASSKDLIHWSKQKLLNVMKNEPQARNVWAPEIFYDAIQKQFVIFWASTIPGRFPATDKTGDNGYNHRMYFTVTTDFDRLAPAKLLYDPGFSVIDATIVQDGKRFVMFLKDETRHPPAKNLRVTTATSPAGPYGPPSAPITGKYWAEGPTAIQLGDKAGLARAETAPPRAATQVVRQDGCRHPAKTSINLQA